MPRYYVPSINLPDDEHMVDDSYLKANRLALIRVAPDANPWLCLVPGKQFLCPALGPDGPWIIVETISGKRVAEMPGKYELVSDPLKLLSKDEGSIQKKQVHNYEEFQKLHPELFGQSRSSILLPSGRTKYEETVYLEFKERLQEEGKTIDNESLLSMLDECLRKNRYYIRV